MNDRLAHVGDKADLMVDNITIDRVLITPAEKLTYILLNKPRQVETTLTKQGSRASVRDLVTSNERIYPVGRLDADSEGLILLTNDGELTDHLTHPRYGHEKEYHVLVDGYPNEIQLTTWRRGVVLNDGVKTAPARVRLIRKGASGTWLRVIMCEGRKRQIRRSAALLGLRVKRLQRVRLGTLRLGKLAPGEYRQLDADEIAALRCEVLRPRGKHKRAHQPKSHAPIK